MESSTEMHALIISKLDDIAEDVKTLRRIVSEGNGRPPLTERVAALEARPAPKQRTKKAAAGFWGAIVAISGAVTALIHACAGLT